jgi:hypothetical protein
MREEGSTITEWKPTAPRYENSRAPKGNAVANYSIGPIAEWARSLLNFEPDANQVAVLESTANRAILNCTRQWGKSTVCALKAVHRAVSKPGSLIVIACPSQRQSSEFLLKASVFLEQLGINPRGDGHQRFSLLLPNHSRLIALPGKYHNTIRGFSALSLLIIDEAALVPEPLYRTLRPMLAVSRGDLWLLSTPYGKRGFFYREWAFGGDRWTRFRVPATECLRIPPEFLEEERESSGSLYFGQEYMCEFHATDDAIFHEELIRNALCNAIDPLVVDEI